MLKDGTLFIVGAAVSAELGLPLGSGLREKMIQILPDANGNGGDRNLRALIEHQENSQRYFACAARIREALPFAASIDNLVDHHRGDECYIRVAKWAIATVISREEATSIIGSAYRADPSSSNFPATSQETSYHDLFRLIVTGASRDQLSTAFSRLRIITFNYDRTIEVFFNRALMAHSSLTPAEAEEIVSGATILHAYGALDPHRFVEWQRNSLNAVYHHDQIHDLAEGVRTFSEKHQSGERNDLRELMASANRLIFLGCHYHGQNLDLIKPDSLAAKEVYGTVYIPAPRDPASNAMPSLVEFSQPTIDDLRSTFLSWVMADELDPLRPTGIHFRAMTCRQLIAHYGVKWVE